MKEIKSLVFVSNYFNHHQKPFCEAMYNLLGDGFKFIETDKMTVERKKMGYDRISFSDYVIKKDVYERNLFKYQKLINDADVVIIGSASEFLIEKRKKENKLIFRYSERVLKKGLEALKYIPRLIKWNLKNRSNNIYMLCASAYTSADYEKFFLFKNKCYKWGYFPKVEKYNIEELLRNKFSEKNNSCASILWVGRLIGWKHPDASILLAEKLKNEGYNFKLSIIGTGELEENLKNMIIEKKLSDCVNILGAMSPEEVREYMKEADIYLFTSDRNEGWGAVLNESMNSGCAVVASHAIGSVPFLIENEKNGLIYKDGDYEDFYKKVMLLLDSKERRQELSKNAYFTMTEIWNAENAAKRFISLAQSILDGEKNPDIFKTGVCSRAKKIRDDWFE